MTPKEKAIELVNKIYYQIYDANTRRQSTKTMVAKECALIAVDEILDDGNASSPFEEYRIMYWNEVKQEIKIL